MRWGFREHSWAKPAGREVQPGKTVWDVFQLLVVPLMLAVIAIAFNASQTGRDRHRAEDVRHEQNLQSYFEDISDLILHESLLTSGENAPVRAVARNLTLATLRTLDGRRKAQVVAFLSDARLLYPNDSDPGHPVVSLADADLGGADFRDSAYLQRASLASTSLRHARFDGVRLFGIDFDNANLRDASFRGAVVLGVSFDHADLRSAHFDPARVGDEHHAPVSFDDACLSSTSFADASVTNTTFRRTEGSRTNVNGARLRHVSLEDAVLVDVVGRAPDWGVHRRDKAARAHPCATLFGRP